MIRVILAIDSDLDGQLRRNILILSAFNRFYFRPYRPLFSRQRQGTAGDKPASLPSPGAKLAESINFLEASADFRLVKEISNFASGRFWRVRAMHSVRINGLGKIGANRTCSGFLGVGRTHYLAIFGNC